MSVRTFDNFLEERLQDEEFRKEHESLQPDFATLQALIETSGTSSRQNLGDYLGIMRVNNPQKL